MKKEQLQTLMEWMNRQGIPYLTDAPMRDYTTFRAGGPADLLISPKSAEQIRAVLQMCRQLEVPVTLLGNGSNVLVRDGGIRGAALRLGSEFSQIQIEGSMVIAQAGAKLAAVVSAALNAGLVGMEFAGGIPGSVGGGIYMNAGAYGGELSQVLHSALVLTADLEIVQMPSEALSLSYRHSALMENGALVLEGRFCLEPGDTAAAREYLRELAARRREKQPLDLPSAGSTFKRPAGHYAGALIESAGLKGFSIGGAQVSEKHAGFVVNRGGSAADILALIRHVQECVSAQSGIWLEPEVLILGED
jgi:UDP-N-acetylmuramate dehydrogenase